MRTARSIGLHLALGFVLLLCLARPSLAQFADVAVAPPLNDSGDSYGAAWIDYDNDGDLDVFFANALTGDNKLLRNDSGTFVDITPSLVADSGMVGSGVAWGDYDNDGDPDLFVANAGGGADRLFRNDGGGVFVDATTAPLGDTGTGFAAAWADYDRDGDLDLSLTNSNEANKLFRNEGNGSFVDVTPAQMGDTGTGMAWGDYDGDGDPDLYLGDNATGGHLLRNDGGENFADVTAGPLAAIAVRGVDWGDYDNDGDLDLALTRSQAVLLLRNDGGVGGGFVSAFPFSGTNIGTGIAWGDFNLDGNLDLYIGRDGAANALFRNDGGSFTNVTSGDEDNGGRPCRGVAWGDYNGDGALDIYVANTNGFANRLLVNLFPVSNSWLHVKLTGTISNRSGIGARVRAVAGSLQQVREVSGGSGYASQNSLPVEFGLGLASTVDTLEIRWPSGRLDRLTNVATNQVLNITETEWSEVVSGGVADTGNGRGVAWGDYDQDGDLDLYLVNQGSSNKLFRNEGSGVFADATTSPLGNVGNGQSAAWGDYDNDGDLDLYLSNFQQDNKLFRNEGFEFFVNIPGGHPSFNGRSRGVTWVDSDKDGDLDIYLVVEFGSRLLRNDNGTFLAQTSGPLWDTGNGHTAAWGDYDRDGDIDAYLVKGNETNRLVRNDGSGTFVDVTSSPLGDTGDGRSAAWADYDGDQDLDLYLANRAGANKLFRNEGGSTFVDVTSGPLGDTGNGMGVAWGDYDNDGDPDLYLANDGSANKLFRNDGNGVFASVTSGSLNDVASGQGVAWGDYDQDGDLDLYLANSGTANKLFRNDIVTTNHWLEVNVVGTRSNRAGIGARVTVVTGATRRSQDVSGGTGYFSQNSLPVEFGLGSSTTIDSLIVEWPSGLRQIVTPPPVNTLVTVQESDGSFSGVATGLLAVPGGVGAAWGDYDKDGDLDLFQTAPNQLFRNDGGGSFANVGGPFIGYAECATWGDYDNDEDLDLYITFNSSANQLIRNDGGTFHEVTSPPLDLNDLSKQATWVDYDSDGDIDLFLLTGSGGNGNWLFRNEGAGNFVDVTSGPMVGAPSGNNAAWGDYDSDGDPDVFITNDFFGTNRLLRNDGGGVFANVTNAPLNGRGQGVAWGDYDNDGDLDLYVSQADLVNPNKLFRNEGGGVFVDATSGPLGDIGQGFGVAWGDYDNDGDLDLRLAKTQSDSRLFRNEGGPGYAFVNVVSGPLLAQSFGAAWGDYDSDGDIDLFVPSGNATTGRLMRNEVGSTKRWLQLKLTGTVSNRSAIGARVRTVAGSLKQIQEVSGGSGYYSQNSLPVEFGFGATTTIDTVEVRWPSGIVQRLTNVATNQVLTVTESEWTNVSTDPADAAVDRSAGWGDYDNDGDEDLYVAVNGTKKLLRNDGSNVFVNVTPSVLTSPAGIGNGVAWADYDNDGDLDLYLVNIAGDTNQLFRNEGAGIFTNATTGPLATLGQGSSGNWGDYDNDGDVDLYLTFTSGTNQLLRNDGNGVFADVTSGPLGESGDTRRATWVDYDNDRDLDLYLSKHLSPNKLLRNDGNGVFADVTSGPLASNAEGRGTPWGDYDNDGDLDVFLAIDFGPDKLLRNDGAGSFADITPALIADPTRGVDGSWADYDRDGDLDLYVTNLGDSRQRLFRNDGGSFVDFASGEIGDYATSGSGSTPGPPIWADSDLDGDLDVYIPWSMSSGSTGNRFFRNDALNSNHWLKVKLTGTVSNRSGIGAHIRCVTGSLEQMREVSGGHRSQHSMVQFFGVGAAAVIDTVEVRWPSGITQRLTDVATNQVLNVTEQGFAVISGPFSNSGLGVAWGDYDKDADPDLFVSKAGQTSRLFRNDGTDTFVNVTGGALLTTGPGMSVAWGDYDNDGDLDVYQVNSSQPNKLFRNNGSGVFADVTTGPLGHNANGQGVGWADYEGDGDVDLFVTNHLGMNKLFRNEGADTFSDIVSTPLTVTGSTHGMAWGDYDGDGDLDLFICDQDNDSGNQGSSLFRNEGGGVFVNATTVVLRQSTATAAAWGDYDNDGDLDLYTTGGSNDYNRLLRNDGAPGFFDVTSGPLACPGECAQLVPTWGDYDNDGDLDLYITNTGGAYNSLLRNDGGGVFAEAGSVGGSGYSGGAAWGDYDLDGDLDLYLTSTNLASDVLVRNDISSPNHWLHVDLMGSKSNRAAIGARVRIVSGSLLQVREVSGGSYLSQNSLTVAFGLGTHTSVDTLEIRWPSGNIQRLTDVAVDQRMTVQESEFSDATSGPLGYVGNAAGVAWGDYDNDDDLDIFLSNSASEPDKLFRNEGDGTFIDATSGPLGDTGNGEGVAWGDYDNDGDLDLYLANSGQANKLLQNQGGGAFSDATSGPLGDTGGGRNVSWTDYDRDGDVDIYLTNFTGTHKLFRNDGGGNFDDATPALLGGTGSWGMAWADYDNDGDLDLYLSTNSGGDKLFRNDGGTFADVTSGALNDPGNGHGVAWADYDNDGDLDVFVTNGITGDNKLFRNDGGATFADVTTLPLANAGQNDQGVAWGDYDLDGDQDLYVSSFGPNKLFRNEGGGVFADVSFGPVADSGNGNGVAWGDYDGDGDLDLYFANAGSANKLLRNNLANGNHWLHVHLVGTTSNRAGIGARVRAVSGSLKQIQEVSGGSGLFSQNSLALEFGLGTRTTVDTLEVRWPSGKVQKLTQLSVDESITVVEPLDAPTSSSYPLVVWTAPSDPGQEAGLLGYTVGAAGDVNGDGYKDVLIGSSQGKVLLLLGGVSSDGVPDLTLRTESPDVYPYEEFGRSLAGVGDVNGDGYADWIVGARSHYGFGSQSGRAYLYLGGATVDGVADVILDGQLSGDQLGASVAGVGDLNQDGYDDWAVAASGQDAGGTDAGRVYIYFGSASPDGTADLSITGIAAQGFFARKVSGGGDLNADGFDDLVIGAQGADQARVFLGGSAVNSVADLVVPKPAGHASNDFGIALSMLGDLNADGFDDFSIDGTDFPTASMRHYIYLGSTTLDGVADLTLSTPGNSATSAALGDINADGFNDLAVGDQEASSGGRHGAVSVFYGRKTLSTAADLVLRGETDQSAFGLAVAGCGDVNQDGVGDFAVGDPVYDVPPPPNGRAYVFLGATNWADVTATGPLGVSGHSAGAAWGDYDSDNDLDLYVSSTDQANKLFRNEGGGAFADATSGPLGDAGVAGGIAWGDYDRDGDLDLYLAKQGQANKLFRNDGAGTFADMPSPLLGDTGNGYGVAWGDFDNDGDLDLYLVNNGQSNKLFRNEGAGAFVDATSGPLGDTGNGAGVAAGDYDSDGDLDLYVVNGGPSKLLRNEGGLTFTDVTTGLLADPGFGFGATWGDYDGDGDLDLYKSNNGPTSPNKLFRNDAGVFVNATTGPLADAGSGHGTAWADYDLDGDLDLFLANDTDPCRLFRNEGSGVFVATTGPLGSLTAGNDGAWGDVDQDGDLDLYVTRWGQPNKLYRNDQDLDHHWLHVKLVGTLSNRWGVGARLRTVAGSLKQIQEVTGGGYLSQNSLIAEFGLGTNTTVDTLEIRWPSGITQVLTDVAADNRVTIQESQFTDVTTGPLGDAGYGRGVAWGDYDNDGDEDLFFANTFGPERNHLFRNDAGTLVEATPAHLDTAVAGYGAAWADVDNDGDLDLCLTGDSLIELYRNQGGGTFTNAPIGDFVVGGAWRGVGWADYDLDGDVDLFVANQGNTNKLLRNDGGNSFADVTSGDLAVPMPGWTVAWGDYDGDRDPDLCLTLSPSGGDKLFRNDSGIFSNVTQDPIGIPGDGPSASWGDYDNDGDLDLFLSKYAAPNILCRNDAGTFVNVTGSAMGFSGNSTCSTWGDADNDGDLDLFLSLLGAPNKLFRNDGSGSFVDATSGPLALSDNGTGTAWADIDSDGDLDLYLANSHTANKLFRNDVAPRYHWLEVKLTGASSNRSAIGARIRAKAGTISQIRDVEGVSGMLSQNSLPVEFGLGVAAIVDTLEIRWPSGTVQILKNVATNQRLIVTEPAAGPDIVSIDKTAAPNTGTCALVLTGFRQDVAGTVVSLTGPATIPGTVTAASGTGLTATFNVTSAAVGSYNVSVTNSLGSDVLNGALVVHSPGIVMTRSTQSAAVDTDPVIPHTSGSMDTMVFVSTRGGASDLYLKNPLAPDTAPLTALTSLGSVANPSISPDGRKVVFENAGSLYILDLQTLGSPTLLTAGLEPEWSPLGNLIAYRKAVGGGRYAIFSIHPDGTMDVQLTNPVGTTIDSSPTWSPDEKRIAFLRNLTTFDPAPVLRIMPSSGGEGIGISAPTGLRRVGWSPEGGWIAASTNAFALSRIYLVNPSGQGWIQVFQDAAEGAKPCWNADGSQLAFSSTYSGNQDVYVVSGIGSLADADADLVPDALDACASTAPAAGQIDRNFNGCGDPSSSFRFPRFWNADQLPILYQVTAAGDPRISDGSEFVSLQDAFNAWVGIPGAALSGGDDATHSGPREVIAADGKNSISFGDEDGFIAGTLAVTLSTVAEEDTVINGRWYRPGEIVDADILFNANEFNFSTATTVPTTDSYNLRAVATHEFGHFFGLSHSVVVGSTMYVVVPRNTSAWSLERDDVALARRGYAPDTTRSIDGRVLRSNGTTPVVGAAVMAIASSAPVDTLQMTVTGVDGSYRFYDLDRSFRVFVAPLDGGDGVNDITASYINRDLASLVETDFQAEFWDGGSETNNDGGPGVVTVSPGPLVSNANIILDVDVTPPQVASTFPEEGDTVSVTGAIIIRFNEMIDFSSVGSTDISLRNLDQDTGVGGVAAGLDDNTVIAFTPSAPLAFATDYRLTVRADIKDAAGNTLADSTVVNFQTEAQPGVALTSISPPTAAPGCAIVIHGEGFDPDPEENTIQFAGASVSPTAATLDRLYAIVPPGATTGTVTVTVAANTSNGLEFSVLAPRPPPSANLVGERSFGVRPRRMDIAPDGSYVYVASETGVTAIPTTPSNLTGPAVQVPVPGGCLDVVAMPGGNLVFALRSTAPELQVLDTSVPGVMTLVKEVSLGTTPLGLAVVPGGGMVVISFANKLALVATPGGVHAPEFGQIIREWTYDAGPFLGSLSLSRDGTRIFAAAGDNRFAVFDATAGGGVIGSLRSGSPRETVAIPDGGSALGVDLSGTILEFDNEGTVRTVLAGGGGYAGVAVSPEGNYGYAADFILNHVDVLDLSVATTARIATFDTGIDPVDLIVAPDGATIYVLTEGDRTLEAYDTIEGPYVAGYSPVSGGPGTLITLTGANFNPTPGANFVSMGNVVLTPIWVSPAGTSMVVEQTALVTEGHLAVTTGGKTSNVVEYRVVHQTDPGNFALASAFPAMVASAQTALRSPDGQFFIVRGADGTLTMLGESPERTKFHRVLGSLSPSASGLSGPGPLLITPDGTTLFAGNRSASRVLAYALDASAPNPITYAGTVQNLTSPAILDPASMAITPDGTRVYVASTADNRIVEFATATRMVTASISGPFTAPTAIAMHPFGRRAYVLLNDSVPGIRVGVFNVDPISAGYRTRVGTVTLTGSPTSMHCLLASPNGDRVYALVGSGSAYALKHINSDSTSGNYLQEIGSLPAGSGVDVPVAELNQSGTFAFVVDPVATTLRVIDLSSFTFTADLITGSGLGLAKDIDISADDSRVYVATGNSFFQADLTTASSLAFIAGSNQVGVENQALTFPIAVRSAPGSAGAAVTFEAVGGGGFGEGDAFAYSALDATGTARTQFNPGSGMGTRTVKAMLSGVTIQTTVTVVGDTALVPVQVVSTSPASFVTLGVLTSVAATFSKGVNPATVDATSFPLKQSGVTVEGTYHFSDHERRITFVPRSPLAFSTTYTAELTPLLEDYNGNPLDNPTSFSFQTESAPTTVTISALSPTAGTVGSPVVISGDGFESTPSANTVLFGATAATVERADPKALLTHVPYGAETGPVTVTARSQTSNGQVFEVIVPAPEPVLDPSGDVDVPTSGNQVVVTPDEVRAYMTSPEGNTVVPILLETLVSEDPIAVGIYPLGIALSPDGRRAFVANYYSDDVYVIGTEVESLDFQSVVATIPFSNHPIAAAVNPNGRELYVATAGTQGEVIILEADVETDTYPAKKSISTGSSNQTVTVTTDGGQLVIGTSFGIVLVDIEGDDYGAKKSISTGSSSQSVTVTPDGGFVLVLTATGTLLLIDIHPGLTEEEIEDAKKSIETGSSSQAVTVSPDGGTVYVSTADGRILVFALTLTGGETALAERSDAGLSLVPTDTLTVGENLAGLSFVNRDKLIVVDAGASSVRLLGGGAQWISCDGVTTNQSGTLLPVETQDVQTVVLPNGAIQISNSLSWTPTIGTNLDLAFYKQTGTNPLTGQLIKRVTGTALPETLLVQGLAPGTYYFEITRTSAVGTQIEWNLQSITCTSGVIGTPEPTPPVAYQLLQSFPNPFRAGAEPARIRFGLRDPGTVRLQLFDVRGELVRTLVHEWMDQGEHEASWDGRTDQGKNAAPGVYFYRFEVESRFVSTRRMLLLR